MRPSIIVGDRHSGWTASFNVLYWPLRALAKGAYPLLPARGSAPVDVVSVDYVADAIVALAGAPDAAHKTFHLTASANASSIDELLALAVARLGCERPPLISPRLYRHVLHPLLCRALPRRRRFLRATEDYLPYFAIGVTYDNAGARAALAPSIAPAPLAAYFDELVGVRAASPLGRPPAHPRGRERHAACERAPHASLTAAFHGGVFPRPRGRSNRSPMALPYKIARCTAARGKMTR